MTRRLADTRADCARVVALELVGAVRALDAEAVKAALDVADLPALAVVLAAMVDDGKTESELLGWLPDEPYTGGRPLQPAQRIVPPPVRPRLPLQPCGTHSAYVRHKARGEDVCDVCLVAEREYQRNRPGRRPGARARRAA